MRQIARDFVSIVLLAIALLLFISGKSFLVLLVGLACHLAGLRLLMPKSEVPK